MSHISQMHSVQYLTYMTYMTTMTGYLFSGAKLRAAGQISR